MHIDTSTSGQAIITIYDDSAEPAAPQETVDGTTQPAAPEAEAAPAQAGLAFAAINGADAPTPALPNGIDPAK